MSAAVDNSEWKLQNEKFRRPNIRKPDVYFMRFAKVGDKCYVTLADGWNAPGQRRQVPIPVPPDITSNQEIRQFGEAEARKLAVARGLAVDGGDQRNRPTRSAGGAAKGDIPFGVALNEVEADATAGVNKQTAGNSVAGCRELRNRLPAERLSVATRRITPKELERHVRQSIIDEPMLSRDTKLQYLADARAIVRILIEDYDMDEDCEAALRAPPNMPGADTEERPFLDADINRMENEVGGQRFQEVLRRWADATEGAYYLGSRFFFQPVDVVFRRHDEFTADLKYIFGRRHKTGEFFFLAVPDCVRTWLLKRRAKGGIYADGYILPEFVYGIRKCLKATGPLGIFTHHQEEDRETNVTGRLRDFFEKLLGEVCEIKRAGISFVSFRHYGLPVLRVLGAPVEVGMDMAGQSTIEAYFGYGGHGTAQQHLNVCAMLDRHYRNRKEGKNETVVVTHWDTAQYVLKALLKVMKKLLNAIESSTSEVLRKVGQLVAIVTAEFRTTHAKLDALNDSVVNLEGAMHELRHAQRERVVAIGTPILSFAPIQELGSCRQLAARPEARNDNNASAAIELDTYII